MRYTFEEEFRLDHPETVGETDSHFDLDNYKDWLEDQLTECRKQLSVQNISNKKKCDLCNGTGYLSIDNMVVECGSCSYRM